MLLRHSPAKLNVHLVGFGFAAHLLEFLPQSFKLCGDFFDSLSIVMERFLGEFIYWKIKALDNFVNIFNRCRIYFVASCIMMPNLTEL